MNPAPPRPLNRIEILAKLHETLAPVETYVQVGASSSATWRAAEAAGAAHLIDWRPVGTDMLWSPNQRMHTQTVEEYYTCESCERAVIDLALVDDEDRHIENALRTLVHLQRFCGPQTVLVFADVLPTSQEAAWRTMPPVDWPHRWSGDLFKLPYVLQVYQPRARTLLVDDGATGLLLVAGLDPADVTLDRQFSKICDEYIRGTYPVPTNQVTGLTIRHWNYVPDEVLARAGTVDGHLAIAEIARMRTAGELGRKSRDANVAG